MIFLQAVVPLLKYVRGEDFSDKHWFDTFNLLGMEIKPVDQLTVSDLFKVSKNIEIHSKELQVGLKLTLNEIYTCHQRCLAHMETEIAFHF